MCAASFVPKTELREASLTVDSRPALLVVDVQNYCCHRKGGEFTAESPGSSYYWSQVDESLKKMKSLIDVARGKIEIVYTTIESLTTDGRDRSLDYKISGFNVPRNSWDARVVDEIFPRGDEMVFAKTSCSVFQSTNIGYVLRNLECKQLIIVGGLTDQCVESAVRDACDMGFLVTLVTDACYTQTQERQEFALKAIKGFCRQRTTAQLLEELEGLQEKNMSAADDEIVKASKYVRFELTDMNTKSLCKVVPARHAGDDQYFYSGLIAMGPNAELLTFPEEVESVGCPNWKALPQWETARIVPWASVKTTRVLCEFENCPAVPRTICRRLLEELEEKHGITLYSASELEFTLAVTFQNEWVPAFDGVDIFSTLQFQKIQDIAFEIEEKMLETGIDVKTMNCEYGAGQLEITYAPKFGIAAADAAATFKLGVKEIAAKRGMRASFMTKPFGVNAVGNGGHFNFSLWKNGKNIGFSKDVTQKFVDGVMHHAPGLEALCAPTPPCYERHGHWAPTRADWNYDDRMCAIRVKNSQSENVYMELRMPSASANAYLVIAGLVAAGMHGLESSDLPITKPKDPDAVKLPTSLSESLKALKADKYLVDKLGDGFVRWFDLLKSSEIETLAEWTASYSDEKDEKTAVSKAWQKMYMEYL